MNKRIYIVFSTFIIAVLIIGYFMVKNITAIKEDSAHQEYTIQTETFLAALEERFKRNQILIESMQSFFESSDDVTPVEWNNFIENYNLSETFPAVSWLAFIKKVPEVDKSAFVNQTKELGFTDYKIWPESNNSLHYPILYISPSSFNNLRGYDLSTNAKEQKALSTVRGHNDVINTAPITQISSQANSSERVLFLPVLELGKQNIVGWVATSINFSIIISELAEKTPNLHFDVYSGEKIDFDKLIFQRQVYTDDAKKEYYKTKFDFSGIQWNFVFQLPPPSQSYLKASSFYLVFLLVLVVLSFGLFIYFRYLKQTGQDSVISKLENRVLSSTDVAVVATDVNGMITYFNPAAERLLGYTAGEMVGKNTPQAFHDPQEVEQRAKELSEIFQREVKPGFEVFITFEPNKTSDNRKWTYIRKDQSRIPAHLNVNVIKTETQEVIGYVGFILDFSLIKA